VTVCELLQRAEVNGLTIFLEGGRLMVRTPQEPQGDVRAMIEELRANKKEVELFLNGEDPTLTLEQWYPHFRDLHHKVIEETLDFDWQWLREQRPVLFQSIRDKEAELDRLGDARLSKVVEIMAEWRGLVLQAEMEVTKADRVVQGAPNG